jgi:hypothetical protein
MEEGMKTIYLVYKRVYYHIAGTDIPKKKEDAPELWHIAFTKEKAQEFINDAPSNVHDDLYISEYDRTKTVSQVIYRSVPFHWYKHSYE